MKQSDFQWDPNKDQIYDGDTDLVLRGSASSFNKADGKNFTMDAPWQTLTLELTSGGDNDETTWGGYDESTTIKISRGTFKYIAGDGQTTFLDLVPDAMNLTVENDAQFIAIGSSLEESFFVRSFGILYLKIQDSGSVGIHCDYLNFPASPVSFVNIALSGKAQMAVETSLQFYLKSATVDVASAPDAGYSLEWTSFGPEYAEPMTLISTEMNFHKKANSLLRSQFMTLRDTRIRTEDTAITVLQSDAIKIDGAQFILGPGSAKMQFDGYSPDGLPFEIDVNKPESNYPEGIFEFTSNGTVNRGKFLVRVDSAFTASKIVNSKLIAIDGVPQGRDSKRINCIFNDDKYAEITQVR